MKYIKLLLALLFIPTVALADGWDTEYKRIEQSIREPQFNNKDFVITKYGANPNAKPAANQKAINKAIEACSKAGGGRVVVPEGTFHTGAITLKSKVNLHVEKGAVLQFVFQPELYPIVPTRWEASTATTCSPASTPTSRLTSQSPAREQSTAAARTPHGGNGAARSTTAGSLAR